MRIAYLLPDPGIPVGGVKGASVHVAEVTRALAAAGNDVLLLAMRAAGPAPDGVRLVVHEPGSLPRCPEGDAARTGAVARFFELAEPAVRAFGPDLLYERLSLFAGGGASMAARLGVARRVEVNAPVTAERAGYQGVGDPEAGRRLERAALAGADVIVVSLPLAEWAGSLGAARVTVVPNGVDLARFAPDPRAAVAVRGGHGLHDAQVVGFAGSLRPWHGVDVLIRAAARLARTHPNLRLLVVGDGPERARLEAAAAELLPGRARFTGAVPSHAMPAHLAAFDVATAPYVMPAAGLGFYFSPLKVVEAMAAARPIVASRFPTIEAMLGGTGHLVTPGDPDALANALRALLDDPRASELGARARDRAASSFGWEAVARRIVGLAASAAALDAVPATSAGAPDAVPATSAGAPAVRRSAA
jgi:starch synthase